MNLENSTLAQLEVITADLVKPCGDMIPSSSHLILSYDLQADLNRIMALLEAKPKQVSN